MSSRFSWLSCWLLTLIAGIPQVFADDGTKHTLVYKFKSGDFYHYDVDDRAEMTTQYGEQKTNLRQHTQILKSYRVIAVDDAGGATIEPIMEIIKMASQTGDKPVVIYDSTKSEEAPPEYEKIASTINRPLARFQLSAQGRLLKVSMLATDAPKSFVDAAAKADPSINLLVVLPEQPVKIGDKWSEKVDTSVTVGNGLNRSITLIRSYELASVVDRMATIRVRTTILTPVNDPEILRQLVQQTPSGTIEFDLHLGRIINRSFKVEEKVVGAFGEQSLLMAVGAMTERLVDPNLPRVSNAQPNVLQK